MQEQRSPFIVFKYRDYRYTWIGFFLSQIGSEMMLVAVNWRIYELTHSPLSLGIIGAARFIPMMLIAPIAGLAADMISRKKLIFFSQCVLALSSVFLFILSVFGTESPFYIYALVAAYSGALAFSGPAKQSIIPHLVPRIHFMKAVGLNSLLWQLAVIIGPTIAGFIIGYGGVTTIFIISTFLYLIVPFVLFMIKPIALHPQKPEFGIRAIRQGFGFVRRTPLIWSTMFLDFFATFFASSATLMPIFAKDILKVGPYGLGILYAAPSVGAVFAGLFFSSLHNVKNQGKILLVAVFLYGVSTILFGLSTHFILSLFFLSCAGASDAISSIIRNTIRQMITPDNLRGRMVSVNMIFYQGGPQLGEVEAGLAATVFGTSLSVIFGGVGTIAATIIMAIIVPSLSRYDTHESFATQDMQIKTGKM